jgi:hypothetical protein
LNGSKKPEKGVAWVIKKKIENLPMIAVPVRIEDRPMMQTISPREGKKGEAGKNADPTRSAEKNGSVSVIGTVCMWRIRRKKRNHHRCDDSLLFKVRNTINKREIQ